MGVDRPRHEHVVGLDAVDQREELLLQIVDVPRRLTVGHAQEHDLIGVEPQPPARFETLGAAQRVLRDGSPLPPSSESAPVATTTCTSAPASILRMITAPQPMVSSSG